MNKGIFFFKNASPLVLILIGVGIEIISKLIENKFSENNFVLSLQAIAFIIIVYGISRFFSKR